MRRAIVFLALASLLTGVTALHGERTAAQTSAGPIQASSQLHLPASAFPANYTEDGNEAWPASKADGSSFSKMHVKTYTALGMQGAWYQYHARQLFVPSGGVTLVGPVEVVYLGTYYADASAADSAFSDILSNPQNASPTTCSYGTRCSTYSIRLDFQGITYTGLSRIVQQGNAVAEIRSDVFPQGSSLVTADTFTANVDSASQAFVQMVSSLAPTSTPIPPTATPTSTSVPPSATSTNTSIPPTMTPTSTSVPPSATSTSTSTPLPAPTATPTTPLYQSWKRAMQAEATIRSVHSNGTFFDSKSSFQFVGNCTPGALDMQVSSKDKRGRPVSVEFLTAGNAFWSRSRGTSGSWTKWKRSPGYNADIFITFITALCPQRSATGFGKATRAQVQSLVKDLGSTHVGAVAVRHLRLRAQGYSSDFYLSENNHFWVRWHVPAQQSLPGWTATYSRFNRVTIKTPA